MITESSIFDAVPGTTIIVSTLLPNSNAALAANAAIYNANLRELLATRIAAGQKIVTAEMETGFMTIDDIGSDGTHPTMEGYSKMASVFWYAIQAALAQDMITAPADNGYDDASGGSKPVCLKSLGDTKTELETQVGSGTDDGIYVHKSTNMGVVYTILAEATDAKNNFWFANILGSGRDDIVQFRSTADGTATFVVHQNLGGGSFSAVTGFMDVGWFCNAIGVRWGDFNADGLDDFICVGPEGDISLAINNGGTGLPTFTVVGLIMAAQEDVQNRVRLGDIDGDGRCDYCLVHNNGDLHCWRNGGNGLAPTSAYENGLWQDLGLVWTGGDGGDSDSVMLVDINGDHRTDWLSMDTTGAVDTSTNSRFCNVDPDNFLIDWLDAGKTHAGLGVNGVRDYIKFGRVYGDTGYRSYVHVTNVSSVGGAYQYSFNVFLNQGAGGTRRKADGNHYCDMRGTGSDDYIWVDVTGALTIFGNEHSYPNWVHYGEVYTVPNVYDRRSIHFADMDGDGLCDILHVNTNSGATEVFRNDYDATTDTFSFTYLGFQSGSISCTEGMGVGLRDLGVRFADIDGNGMADYLCIEPDGRTTGWLNMGNNVWDDVGQVKVSVGYDRANHRFVDVNGDGRADFLWIDKFTGEVRVWLNAGQYPALGSSFTWTDEGFRYAGHAQGHCMHYPNIGGLGLADMHYAHSTVNNAETWFNTCGGTASYETNGDDGDLTNPELEVFTLPASSSVTGVYEVSGSTSSACIAGTGVDSPSGMAVLCVETCKYNSCPSPCMCTAYGTLVIPPEGDGSQGTGVGGSSAVVDSLCALACPLGVCPEGLCVDSASSGTSTSYSCSDTGNEAWRCVTCQFNDTLASVGLEVATIWDNSQAEIAMSTFPEWYELGRADGSLKADLTFSQALGVYFGYNTQVSCIVGGAFSDSCWDDVPCNGDDYTIAAAQVISSFTRFFKFYQAWWKALDNTLTDWDGLSTDFVDTFLDNESQLLATLDQWLLSSVFEALGGPIWKKISGSLSLPEEGEVTEKAQEAFQAAYDTATEDLSDYIGLVSDSETTTADALSKLTDIAQWLIQTQKNAIANYANDILNGGSNANVSSFMQQIHSGTWMQIFNTTEDAIRTQAKKLVMATMIPYAWQYDGTLWPVFVVSNKADDTSNNYWNKAETIQLSSSAVAASRASFDDKTFWLLGMRDCETRSAKTGDCQQSQWETLSGYGDLDGNVQTWGNLTITEMAQSSWGGYQLNGMANGYSISENPQAMITDETGTLSSIAGAQGVLTPGFVTIPMCTQALAEVNWGYYEYTEASGGSDRCDTYPCCSCDYMGLDCDDDDDLVIT
jgi:hypothetical protein